MGEELVARVLLESSCRSQPVASLMPQGNKGTNAVSSLSSCCREVGGLSVPPQSRASLIAMVS